MHIQKFSDEAMRDASVVADDETMFRILLADANAQLATQTPAIAPELSETLQWAANTIERLCDCEADPGDTKKCLVAIHKVLSELAPQQEHHGYSEAYLEESGRSIKRAMREAAQTASAPDATEALRPMTHAEACALKPGDKVVCLGAPFGRTTKGRTYFIRGCIDEDCFIFADDNFRFFLKESTCHLFAALPSAEQSPPAADATMQRVAEAIGCLAEYIQDESNTAYHIALTDLAMALGFEILPAQPIRVVVKEDAAPAPKTAILRLNVMRAKGFNYYIHDANPSVPLANATDVERATADVPIRVVAKGDGR